MKYRILFIDDDYEYAAYMKQLLESTGDYHELLYSDGLQKLGIDEVPEVLVDIVLLDIRFPEESSIIKIGEIKSIYTKAQVVMFTASEDYTDLIRSFEMGADGYILKSYDKNDIIDSLRIFHKNGAFISAYMAKKMIQSFQSTSKSISFAKKLTDKDIELLRVLSFGYTYKKAAEEIGLSVDGIRSRIKSIYKKLNVKSKIEAVNYYINNIN